MQETGTCRGCALTITRQDGGAWVADAEATTADGVSYCPPDPDAPHHDSHRPVTAEVLDANGDPVRVPDGVDLDVARQFYAGRVPAPACPHYMAVSEVRAGLTTCERCG